MLTFAAETRRHIPAERRGWDRHQGPAACRTTRLWLVRTEQALVIAIGARAVYAQSGTPHPAPVRVR
jgi:hypothetical protein